MAHVKKISIEYGASLIEYLLIVSFVAVVAISSVRSIRNVVDLYTWIAGIFIVSPTTYNPDGSATINLWVPPEAFRRFANYMPSPDPDAWCRVEFTQPSSTWDSTDGYSRIVLMVSPEHVQECGNTSEIQLSQTD